MLFTQEEVAFIMQVSKSNQENYLETQKREKKKEKENLILYHLYYEF